MSRFLWVSPHPFSSLSSALLQRPAGGALYLLWSRSAFVCYYFLLLPAARGREQGARLQKVASEFVLWGYLCCSGRWDPELSSSGPSSPSSPFDRVVAGDFGGEPSSAVFQFPNVGGPSQEDSADDAYASSHTQSQGPPKIPGAQEDQDGSSPGRTDSDTPSGEKIPEQIQASSGAVSSWQHDSRRRPLVQPEDIWLPRVEPSDGHEESGTVTAGERKHKGGGGELVRSSSFARPSRGTDGGQEDTDSKDADASGRPRTSSAGRGHVQTWLGDRHASLRYSFEGVKDKMVRLRDCAVVESSTLVAFHLWVGMLECSTLSRPLFVFKALIKIGCAVCFLGCSKGQGKARRGCGCGP